MTDIKPFSTYPEDRAKLLELSAKAANSDDAAAIELADLVTAILTDEQALLDAEMFEEMTAEFSKGIDQAWENFKAAVPVAQVVNDNQPGKTAIIEILSEPPTLGVGTKLFAAPVQVSWQRLKAVEVAARRLAYIVRKSVNSGPLSNDPTSEGQAWRELRKALGEDEAQA